MRYVSEGIRVLLERSTMCQFAQNLDPFGESVLNMAGVTHYHRYNLTEKGLSTFSLSIFYVDNSGSGDPVRVTLFQDIFNDGLFVGDDLTFTNGAGDTASAVTARSTCPSRGSQVWAGASH